MSAHTSPPVLAAYMVPRTFSQMRITTKAADETLWKDRCAAVRKYMVDTILVMADARTADDSDEVVCEDDEENEQGNNDFGTPTRSVPRFTPERAMQMVANWGRAILAFDLEQFKNRPIEEELRAFYATQPDEISNLARHFLSAMPSEARDERVFSTLRRVRSGFRTSLSDDQLEKLVVSQHYLNSLTKGEKEKFIQLVVEKVRHNDA